jgi:hypothetical protein
LAREQVDDLYFATHDSELATAARAMGFKRTWSVPAARAQKPIAMKCPTCGQDNPVPSGA